MIKILVVCFLLLNGCRYAAYSKTDSVRLEAFAKRPFIRSQILPLGLITTGALLNIGSIKNRIYDRTPKTNNALDDYFQYTPKVQMYVYDACGFKHANTVFDQTKYLLISQLTSSALVHFLKYATSIERPTGALTSFPSGHTTNAFVGATVLYHEFKDAEPLLAYSGYLFAIATGALRMTNDAHWLPDVLAGAGIGILTVNLVYHFKPLKNFQPFKKKEIALTPLIGPTKLGFVCQF